MLTLLSRSCFASSLMNLSTILRMMSLVMLWNQMMPSRRLRNSGVKTRLISTIALLLSESPLSSCEKPMEFLTVSLTPALVVMMMIALVKSTLLPRPSSSEPLSNTWSMRLSMV